jgi:hypothetical protein
VAGTAAVIEQWDARMLWRGIANGLILAAVLWAAIAICVWLVVR